MIVSTDISSEDDKDIGHRTKMRDDHWKANTKVMEAHPEMRLMLSILWTPRPDDWPRDKSYDDTHTSIMTGDEEVSTEQLEKFLYMATEQLVRLYERVHRRDKELLDKMSKGK